MRCICDGSTVERLLLCCSYPSLADVSLWCVWWQGTAVPQFWSRVETENGAVGLVKTKNLEDPPPEPSPKKQKAYLEDSDESD